MADIRPFRGFRPPASLVEQVASPPYDVLTSAEARAMAAGNQYSFLHICKPEIDLPESVPLYDDRVYRRGADNLARFIKEGVLVQDESPCLYIYRQTMGGRAQTGVVAGASIREYEAGRIKKHELTRKDKEDDRTRHIDAQNAQAEPVFLTHRARPGIDALVARITSSPPVYDFVAADGVGHVFWLVQDRGSIAALVQEFAQLDSMYVADGHHRSASAWRVAEMRRARNLRRSGGEPYEFFLAVVFPHDQIAIMDYNRVVLDLNGLSEQAFLARVAEAFEVAPAPTPRPEGPNRFGMFLGGRWLRLVARAGSFPAGDPVRSLDVSILQDNLLAPILGIGDVRTDKRIDFIGGGRGIAELERRCRQDARVAFLLHPTSIEQLMAIADAGQVMPPKSTWFEPKLRSGLVVRLLAE